MPKTNPNGFPEWEIGSPLPEEDVLFAFKGNLYYWHKCPCSNPFCKRPLVYAENGEKSKPMTIRLRGDKSGMPIVEVLMAIGFTVDFIATQLEDGTPIHEQFADQIRHLQSREEMQAFADKYGIDHDTFGLALIDGLSDAVEEAMHDQAQMFDNLAMGFAISQPPKPPDQSTFGTN